MGTQPMLINAVNQYGVSIFANNCINNGHSQGGSKYEEFALFVEDVTHIVNRNPSVFALPGVDQGSGLPKIYSIDFGMLEETIILSGSIADGESNQYLPTVHDIMRIARTWWVAFTLDGANTTGFNRLLLQTAGSWNDVFKNPVAEGSPNWEIYGFTFQNVQTSRTGGKLEWGYKATLGVVKFPEEIDPITGKAMEWMAA